MPEGTKRMKGPKREGCGGIEKRNRLGPSERGDRSDHAVKKLGSGYQELYCWEAWEQTELWKAESCIAWGFSLSSCLGKGEANSRGFVLTTVISSCRGADVLQPTPVPSLEPLHEALGTHLSICWGAQQDGEEQGHAEHCDLHVSLRCGESWMRLEKVRGRFIPPRTPPLPPGQSQTWQRHQPWQQAWPRRSHPCLQHGFSHLCRHQSSFLHEAAGHASAQASGGGEGEQTKDP